MSRQYLFPRLARHACDPRRSLYAVRGRRRDNILFIHARILPVLTIAVWFKESAIAAPSPRSAFCEFMGVETPLNTRAARSKWAVDGYTTKPYCVPCARRSRHLERAAWRLLSSRFRRWLSFLRPSSEFIIIIFFLSFLRMCRISSSR